MECDKPKIHSRYVVWQESPVSAVLQAVARSWLSDRPGRADALGIAIRGTEVESCRKATLITAAPQGEAKVELVSVGHGEALSCCKGAGGIGLALRLGVGNLGSEEPFDLGFAIADAATVGGVFAYGAIPIAVDGSLLWAIRIKLCVRVSCFLFKGVSITYYEFPVGNRIDAS